MRLKREENSKKFPERVEEHSLNVAVVVGGSRETNPEARAYMLRRVYPDEFWKLDKNILGLPALYAVLWVENDQHFYVWPTPDLEYEFEVRYCPAMKVWK